MKLPARILLIVGGLALVGAIGVLSYGGFEVWRQFLALDAIRSREFANPLGLMIGGASLALLAGLLAGYALGLPRKPKSELPAGPDRPSGRPSDTTATRPAEPAPNPETDLR